MAGYGAYLTRELLDQAIQKKSRQLNQRFYRMEKANKGLRESAYYYAQSETGKSKPRYSTSINKISKLSDEEAKEQLLTIDKKLKSKSSTFRGLEEISNNRVRESVKSLVNELNLEYEDFDVKDFQKFLTMNKGSGGKLMNKYFDSTQLIEDWIDKRKQGITNREFITIYNNFLNDTKKPFDQLDIELAFYNKIKEKQEKKKKRSK